MRRRCVASRPKLAPSSKANRRLGVEEVGGLIKGACNYYDDDDNDADDRDDDDNNVDNGEKLRSRRI